MAIVVHINSNDRMRFLSNGQNWSGREVSVTVAEEKVNVSAMFAMNLLPGHRKCRVQVPVFIEIADRNVAF